MSLMIKSTKRDSEARRRILGSNEIQSLEQRLRLQIQGEGRNDTVAESKDMECI
jgi:hypothetical protein